MSPGAQLPQKHREAGAELFEAAPQLQSCAGKSEWGVNKFQNTLKNQRLGLLEKASVRILVKPKIHI